MPSDLAHHPLVLHAWLNARALRQKCVVRPAFGRIDCASFRLCLVVVRRVSLAIKVVRFLVKLRYWSANLH